MALRRWITDSKFTDDIYGNMDVEHNILQGPSLNELKNNGIWHFPYLRPALHVNAFKLNGCLKRRKHSAHYIR